MELSQFIKIDRENKAMSQHEYANEVGINRTTLAYLENGRNPSPATSKKLVAYFKKPLSELLGEDKITRMANLETTNLLIDSLIANNELNDKLTENQWALIRQSIEYEIALKNAIKKKEEN